ncbi:helix-turn-helix transcriptional regulator [Psychrobium sp. nBUS_13]|uniref:helix-turn-helix transcriptional regulator n=1 Tax=Psychrobium sp. nBUS_13 TaxID=3395319 RepID=UPI003EBDD30F
MKIKPNAVQQYRKSKGWSQQHLADLCSVNLRTIQRVENSHTCSLETLNALLAVFEIERDELVIQETELSKIAVTDFTNHPFFDWRKNVGLLIIFGFLVLFSLGYLAIVQQAQVANAEIRWFSDFSISFSSAQANQDSYYVIPFKYYLFIISLGLLLFFSCKNSAIAASIAVIWLPVIYLDNAFYHNRLTPVTIFVSLIIGYAMWLMRQRIKILVNDIQN